MKALELALAERARLIEARDAAIEAMETVAQTAIDETRSLTPEDDAAVEARKAEIVDLDAELTKVDERVAELEQIQERSKAIAARPSLTVISTPATNDVLSDRHASGPQLVDAVTRSLEGRVESPENMAHARSILVRHSDDAEWARGILARSTPEYSSGWKKLITGRADRLTAEERTALSTLTSANGDYLVPTHLDPTIILTNSGTSNAVRAISRVVTLTRPGDSSWQGITSAGVTASFDAQLVEVSDDSPTFGQPSIPTHKAQALIQGSIEFFDDALATDIMMLFGDARDRLEGAKHCVGSGTNEPTGIFTALDANTNVEIVSDTAASIFKEDLDEVYRSVPVRWRRNGKWLMNPIWALAIQNLGTAVSNKYSTDLTEGPADVLYRKEVVESDDAPADVTTTVRDNEIVFGDFSNYVIVDKPGSFAVEYIPMLFNTANNLPDGRRGWYAHWRTGADSANDVAFRLLQDKTSA